MHCDVTCAYVRMYRMAQIKPEGFDGDWFVVCGRACWCFGCSWGGYTVTDSAGTLTGAPKIRAMQIISEFEQTTRGPYGGTVGYFSFNGNLDCCITIRTAMLKDGKAYVQAGGGWVNDSVPEAEFQETVNKAKAMIKAVALAEHSISQ